MAETFGTSPSAVRSLVSLTVEEVSVWLTAKRLKVFVPLFRKEEISGELLADMGADDLEEFGIGKRLQQRALLRLIKHAQSEHIQAGYLLHGASLAGREKLDLGPSPAGSVAFQVPPVLFERGTMGFTVKRAGVGRPEATVKALESGGAAERLGVRLGDVLVAINGFTLLSETFEEVVRRLCQAGRPVTIGFERRGPVESSRQQLYAAGAIERQGGDLQGGLAVAKNVAGPPVPYTYSSPSYLDAPGAAASQPKPEASGGSHGGPALPYAPHRAAGAAGPGADVGGTGGAPRRNLLPPPSPDPPRMKPSRLGRSGASGARDSSAGGEFRGLVGRSQGRMSRADAEAKLSQRPVGSWLLREGSKGFCWTFKQQLTKYLHYLCRGCQDEDAAMQDAVNKLAQAEVDWRTGFVPPSSASPLHHLHHQGGYLRA